MKAWVERWIVIDADQRASRRGGDRVGAALARLSRIDGLRLPFERTAGDEVQALTQDPGVVIATVSVLARLDAEDGASGGWRLGLGVGGVESLEGVGSTREARGEAYLLAREAVERAGHAPGRVSVAGADELAEASLVVLRTLLERRTVKGWDVVEAMRGDKQSEVAATLDISESAVSQRLDRALWREVRHAESLARHHLARALEAGAGEAGAGEPEAGKEV